MKIKTFLPNPSLLSLLLGLLMAGPGQSQTLLHRYSFNDTPGSATFADSITGDPAWAGTLIGSAHLDGQRLQLDGWGGWATLPPGIISTQEKITIEFWASFSANNPVWTRVFAFGDQNDAGQERTALNYCHYAGGDWQNLGVHTAGANVWANNPGGLNGAENVHVTIIVDPPNNQLYYYNGTKLTSNPGVNGGAVPPLRDVNDLYNLIGKSLYDVDPLLEGSIDEFRIYAGVLPASAIVLNEATGPDHYVTSLGTLVAVHLISPDNPLTVNQASPQVFTGDFDNVSGVDLIVYGGATFQSGDPDILTVDAAGVVRAVSPGTTTVVATFNGRSATNTLSVIAQPATLAHRYSFTSDASDALGGADGILMGSATVTGGKLVLDGGGYMDLPGTGINLNTYRAVTIEAWVDFGNFGPWARLFDFGTEGGANEIFLAPSADGNGQHHWLTQNIPGGRNLNLKGGLTNMSAHLTAVVDPPASTLALYVNGVLEYANYNATAPLSLVDNSAATVGRSFVAVDPWLVGAIDEFRIYQGALTPAEIMKSHLAGPASTAYDPGALQSIEIVTTDYPAYSDRFAPVIHAHYANLADFNLMPNTAALVPGLILTSSDATVLEILPGNLVQTRRPGVVTLTASYHGHTDSATIQVRNLAQLTHRYTFETDAKDSVGTAHGILHGTASVSGGNLVLDGADQSYLELPPALLEGYDAVTVDTWVNFGASGTWSRLWYFGDDRANEFYLAPSVLDGSAHWFSAGLTDGDTITIPPAWANLSVHVTCVFGNGVMAYYTNGVLHGAVSGAKGRVDQIGTFFSWIGRSPYADPFAIATVDEFRIYRGTLSADEIKASDAIGPNQLLTTTATLTATRVGDDLVLRWPAAAAGFSVQTTSDLGSGGWTALDATPVLNGDHWEVTLPATEGSQFFRLWR